MTQKVLKVDNVASLNVNYNKISPTGHGVVLQEMGRIILPKYEQKPIISAMYHLALLHYTAVGVVIVINGRVGCMAVIHSYVIRDLMKMSLSLTLHCYWKRIQTLLVCTLHLIYSNIAAGFCIRAQQSAVLRNISLLSVNSNIKNCKKNETVK